MDMHMCGRVSRGLSQAAQQRANQKKVTAADKFVIRWLRSSRGGRQVGFVFHLSPYETRLRV